MEEEKKELTEIEPKDFDLNKTMDSLQQRFKSLLKQGETVEDLLKNRRDPGIEMRRHTITDTLYQWHIEWQPVLIGKSFVIIRSWQEEEIKNSPQFAGRKIVKIDPGVAFSIRDKTTGLCIEALEDYWQGGRLLDIGTGTGILAIAAALLREGQIEAYDISPSIVDHARVNFRVNGLEGVIDLKQASIAAYPVRSYDFVTANIIPDVLDSLKSDIVKLLKPGGVLVISGFMERGQGIINTQFDWQTTSSVSIPADELARRYCSEGLKVLENKTREGFSALVFQRLGDNW